jgi:protein disulfide-isomerase A1
MKLAVFVLCLLATSAIASEKWGFPEEDHVIVLNDSNFEEAIKKFEFILVEFYAPWCGHCKKLAPEYSGAAKILKESDPAVPLAKVDATQSQEIATKHGVQGYPTIKFFIKGEPIDFNGGRTQADIVNWIKKKTGPPSVALSDAAELEKLKTDNKVVIAYFGKDDDHYKNFVKVAQSIEALTFTHSHDTSLNNGASGVVLFKQFDEGVNHYKGDFSLDSLKKFVADHRYPTVMPFEGDEAIERIFGKESPAIILFTDDSNSEQYKSFSEAASEAKGKLVFSHSTVTSGLGQRLADYVGVKAADTPAIWIVAPKQGDLSKFQLYGSISKDAILRFIGEYQSGSLTRHYKSQEIPEKNDEAVKVGVGKNWEDLVINNDKNVLVEFYAPWCGHCKSLAPIYEETAKALAGNEKILLVKVDATENEIPGVSIQGFPTLKFYPAGKKSSPVDYSGERTKDGFMKFFKENCGEDWVDL